MNTPLMQTLFTLRLSPLPFAHFLLPWTTGSHSFKRVIKILNKNLFNTCVAVFQFLIWHVFPFIPQFSFRCTTDVCYPKKKNEKKKKKRKWKDIYVQDANVSYLKKFKPILKTIKKMGKYIVWIFVKGNAIVCLLMVGRLVGWFLQPVHFVESFNTEVIFLQLYSSN